jgi:hypothetical protein
MLDYTRDGMEIATVMPQVPASVPVPRNWSFSLSRCYSKQVKNAAPGGELHVWRDDSWSSETTSLWTEFFEQRGINQGRLWWSTFCKISIDGSQVILQAKKRLYKWEALIWLSIHKIVKTLSSIPYLQSMNVP